MDKILIKGGDRLIGDVRISGAKNAALPIIAATILADSPCTISNAPGLVDIRTMNAMLEHLGSTVSKDGDKLTIDTSTINSHKAPYELVKTMRASVLVLGPLVARYGEAIVSLPGGCAIGARPINLHLDALEKLGAKITLEHGYVKAEAKKLKGARIVFENITVTGTENIMMAACLAEGETILEHSACEPEIVDLANFLNNMGAKIQGAGTDLIRITGVENLNGAEHEIMPDRIEAGTFMVAAAITKGNIRIQNCKMKYLDAVIAKLRDAHVTVESDDGNGFRVIGGHMLKSVDITTAPYPGFPTDMQAQMMVLNCVAEGLSVTKETIFENRYMHVGELERMGAEISVDGRVAVVRGNTHLSGANVMATDLRASASLILAGLVAEGTTEISRVYHLDRGYEMIEEKLRALGADIKRVNN
ncbi:UDP-N-acetylglucosamine 1-carboxyvinyltransferase [Thermodesulfobacteriota bacterium]